MAKIAIFNQKGGVGKTTATLNLTSALARLGLDPLAIDLDPQAHLSAISGARVASSADSIYGFYNNARSLSALICNAGAGWQIIPSHLELSKVETQFGKGPNALNRLNSGIVKENLNTGRPILIDCCPMLGVLSLNAIFASDRVLVPISADFLALKGVMQVEKTLKALEQVLKKKVERRYVVTRFDTRRKMSWEIYRQIGDKFGSDLCETRISENVSVAESPSNNKDVFTHAPSSRGARDYNALLLELMACGFIR